MTPGGNALASLEKWSPEPCFRGPGTPPVPAEHRNLPTAQPESVLHCPPPGGDLVPSAGLGQAPIAPSRSCGRRRRPARSRLRWSAGPLRGSTDLIHRTSRPDPRRDRPASGRPVERPLYGRAAPKNRTRRPKSPPQAEIEPGTAAYAAQSPSCFHPGTRRHRCPRHSITDINGAIIVRHQSFPQIPSLKTYTNYPRQRR